MNHNPENIAPDKIPQGWRLLKGNEFPLAKNKSKKRACRVWIPEFNEFGEDEGYEGDCPEFTYIVKE
jgi:hypothetical protein